MTEKMKAQSQKGMMQMTELEYMNELEFEIKKLPETEQEDALQYVREYFEEARLSGRTVSPETELGTPQEYVRNLRDEIEGASSGRPETPDFLFSITRDESPADYAHSSASPSASLNMDKSRPVQKSSSKGTKTLLTVLLIVLSPILIVLGAALLLVVLMAMMVVILLFLALILLGVMLGVMAAAFGLSIFLLLTKAVMLLGSDLLGSLFDLGGALFCFGLCILAGYGCRLWFMNTVPFAASKIIGFFRWIFALPKKAKERFRGTNSVYRKETV